MIDRRRTAEEAVADMFGVDVNHLRQAPKFCGDGYDGACLKGDCEIVQAVDKLLAHTESALKEKEAPGCKAQRTADSPQDCDMPFCGCDPAWQDALAAAQESGWLTLNEATNLRARLDAAEEERRRFEKAFQEETLRTSGLIRERDALQAAVEQARRAAERLRGIVVNDGRTFGSNPRFERDLDIAVADLLAALAASAPGKENG